MGSLIESEGEVMPPVAGGGDWVTTVKKPGVKEAIENALGGSMDGDKLGQLIAGIGQMQGNTQGITAPKPKKVADYSKTNEALSAYKATLIKQLLEGEEDDEKKKASAIVIKGFDSPWSDDI